MSARLLFVVTLLSLAPSAARADEDDRRIYWLWAIDGRFESSKSPCADSAPRRANPARMAIIDFIGSETYVVVAAGELSLLRGAKLDQPAKQLEGPSGELIAFWYQGMRTWIVTLYPRISPAFASVTLVMERNNKRKGKPLCHERWIAPVSP